MVQPCPSITMRAGLDLISKICLVRKLRETRVLSGFARLLPPGADGGGGGTQPLALRRAIRWLPALVVRGEGTFLEFREEKIPESLARTENAARISRLEQRSNKSRKRAYDARYAAIGPFGDEQCVPFISKSRNRV